MTTFAALSRYKARRMESQTEPLASTLAVISTSKSPEIRLWKNPEKGLEKDSAACQDRPIGWGFHEIRKWLSGSLG